MPVSEETLKMLSYTGRFHLNNSLDGEIFGRWNEAFTTGINFANLLMLSRIYERQILQITV
uniref:Glucose-6-phosphate isomerase n=1 Tax=Heterorhabditis bacteriophora TaxID=37862 RepID=A0A1I7WMF0_HETBA